MRKSMSRVAPKRAVRVYEDAENQGSKEMKKTDSGGQGKFGVQDVPRRPLADLKHQNAPAVVKNQMNATKSRKVGILRKAETEPQPKKPRYEKSTTNIIAAGRYQREAHGRLSRIMNLVYDFNPKGVCSYFSGPETATRKSEAEQNCQSKEDVLSEAVTKRIQSNENLRKLNQTVYSVPYYLKNIYSYLFRLEDRFQIPKDHLEGQEFTGPMRAVLIDWLVGLMDHMDLLQETIQLTVYIIDKFMSIDKNTTKATAQLIGLSALFVAAKYEETEVIELTDLTAVCGHTWLEKDIKSMERKILGAMGYQLGRPLAIHFIRRLTKISGASPMEHCYAKFFADTSLLSYQLCHVKPSKIAAASFFLGTCVSRNRIDTAFWTKELLDSSGYSQEDLQQTVKLMARAVAGAESGKLYGIQSRYSCSQLYCVSIMPGCRPGGIISSF